MIKDKITPSLRKRFSQEITKTTESGKERGFYLCIEKDGKLSAGQTCYGDECGVLLQHPELSCKGKKAQGDFHTHPYLTEVRKRYGIMFEGASDKIIRKAVANFLETKELSPTVPSHGDLIDAITGKCINKTNGSVCIGSDLDVNNIECWTVGNIDEGDCFRAFFERISPEIKTTTPPKEWIIPYFDKEIIRLR